MATKKFQSPKGGGGGARNIIFEKKIISSTFSSVTEKI
jgi:hypothetical protein